MNSVIKIKNQTAGPCEFCGIITQNIFGQLVKKISETEAVIKYYHVCDKHIHKISTLLPKKQNEEISLDIR